LIVLIALAALWAVPGEMSYFTTLEAGVRGVSSCGGISLGVILVSIALVVVVPSFVEVIAVVVPLTVVVSLSSGWCSISVNVHGDQGVVHPSWGI